MRRTRIVATIGPATETPGRLLELVRAGINVARLNLSHGTAAHHVEVVHRVREAAHTAGRRVAVMADVAGPKIRTGRLAGGGPVDLPNGHVIRLVPGDIEGTADSVSITYARLADEIAPGARVMIDDGLIELRVEEIASGHVVARVVHGGPLKERKGVNLPGVRLSIPSITAKDRADLATVLPAGIDYVALSFVRSAEDCRNARDLIHGIDPGVRLVAKIEKPEAVAALGDILQLVDGVMVARGDLGVETPPEEVPVYQKRIIAEAIRAERFSITATQMLQSMVDSPRPTRAEASDVANAVFDGTDAVMLSNETAVGQFPIEAVETMDRIVRHAEASRVADLESLRLAVGSTTGMVGRALAEAALFAAREIGAGAIVVFTQGGGMACHVSALRPPQRIVALTPTERLDNQLAMLWGVESYRIQAGDTVDDLLVELDRAILETGCAARDERVIVLTGSLARPAASTVLKVLRVGDLA